MDTLLLRPFSALRVLKTQKHFFRATNQDSSFCPKFDQENVAYGKVDQMMHYGYLGTILVPCVEKSPFLGTFAYG